MIISLSSFPARLPYIAPCLKSLVAQKRAGDTILVWLGKEQFPHGEDDIPETIRPYLASNGGCVDVRFTDDIRSFTKLLPSLTAFPNDTIITVDDDVAYAPQTIDILKKAHAQNPTAIFAHAVSDLFCSHGDWHRTTGTHGFFTSPQPLRMMLGIGAVLYPPHSLGKLAFDRKLFQRLCPTNDDIWFWYCAAKNGTSIFRVPKAIRRPKMIAATAVGALSATNETNGDEVNRVYIKRIREFDPSFAAIMDETDRKHHLSISFARVTRTLVHYPRQVAYCLRHGGFGFLKAELNRLR